MECLAAEVVLSISIRTSGRVRDVENGVSGGRSNAQDVVPGI